MTGISYVSESAGHIAMPVAGSYVQKRGGEPADPLCEAHYPVAAECKTCHRRIRLDGVLQMEWVHERVVPAATGGDMP
jgi:hypothetical protein